MNAPADHWTAAALLAVALIPLRGVLFGRRRAAAGGRRYASILRSSWLRFGLPPIVLLGLVWRWDAFVRLPPELLGAADWLGVGGISPRERLYLTGAAAVGVGVGVLVGVLLSAWRAWRGRPEGKLFGDASSVRPRGPDELGWAAAVAVTAGVTEEAYFRLLLPLLATLATGRAVAAFIGATLLFGAAHRYQGWRGVLATTFAGAALTAGYLATGSLVAMMAFHAVGDLGHLVLRPAVRGRIEGRRRRQAD